MLFGYLDGIPLLKMHEGLSGCEYSFCKKTVSRAEKTAEQTRHAAVTSALLDRPAEAKLYLRVFQ